MSSVPDISDLLKDGKINFTNEELNKIIDTELAKPESDQNKELINLCRTLSDPKDPPAQESKTGRSFSFRLVSLIVTIAVLIFAMVPVFSKYINTNQISMNPPTETTTNQSTTSENFLTTTEPPTEAISDPTKPATSSDTEASINFLYEPEKIVFCHDGKPQTLTKEMNEEVIKEINSYLRNDYKGGGWKYAAEESMINEIKSHIHIEIYYDSVQTFSTASSTDERKYDHLLVSLEGQYKNIIFFGKDGKYMSIPIGPLYDDDFSENILRHIFDE